MTFITSFKNYLAPISLLIFLGIIATANAGELVLPKCYSKEEITKVLRDENAPPVLSFYTDISLDPKESDLRETLMMMNTETGEGYRTIRGAGKNEGKLCAISSFTEGKLFDNRSLDQHAFLNAVDADRKGIGINNIIYGSSRFEGQNPVFRAIEFEPFYKTTRITYIIANPQKGNKGGVLSSDINGAYDKKYTKAIPSPQSTALTEVQMQIVKNGVKLSPVAMQYIADKQAIKSQ